MNPHRLSLLPLVLLVLACATARAHAEGTRPAGLGIGFHDNRAPIGVRWWMGTSHALDFNVGFRSDEYAGEHYNQYNLQLGVPIVLRSFGRLTAELRPALGYEIQEVPDYAGFPIIEKSTDHLLEPMIELEAEVMVVDHLSVSGAFGFVMTSRKTGATDETITTWSTSGGDFAHVGFHFNFSDPK